MRLTDGGRRAAGFKTLISQGDCVVRAITIATQKPYAEVHAELLARCLKARQRKNHKGLSHPDTGIYKEVYFKYLADIGWKWVPTMGIGTGCKVHLTEHELPKGRLIVRVSKHLTAYINHVIHDTHDPSRAGTRCVYGYWIKEADHASSNGKVRGQRIARIPRPRGVGQRATAQETE